MLSVRCFWRCGTILNAEDDDGDTEGGVVHITGDVVGTGIPWAVGILLKEVEDSIVGGASFKTGWDAFDTGITDSHRFELCKSIVAGIIEETDIGGGFGIDVELKCFVVSLTLQSLSWLLSVVIVMKNYVYNL